MEDTRARWDRAFLEALDFDTWGQVEEATETYQRLQVAAAAEYEENILQLEMKRRDGIGKLASVLKLRVQELQNGSDKSVGLKGMKRVKPFMKEMIISDALFPLYDIDPEVVLGVTIENNLEVEPQPAQYEPEEAPAASNGTLRGRPANLRSGDRVLSIYVEKWGFKEAFNFQEPRVVLSVRDQHGEVVEAVQETPVGKRNPGDNNYIFFDNTIHVQTCLNKLGSKCAIFFEFKHFKPDKKKKSCKCYSFLEMDEIRSGPITLEVYKKPPNYDRNRKPSLLSIKPFYLHLYLTVETYEV